MSGATSRARILCIEDDPEMIELIGVILAQKPYELISVNGGAKGLESARASKPDLVLLDLMMPEMDGWEVYRRMKRDKELATIPVVVVTAKAQNIDKMLGLHIAKVDAYVAKPFEPKELLDSIEMVLRRRKH